MPGYRAIVQGDYHGASIAKAAGNLTGNMAPGALHCTINFVEVIP
jgi:hypothetical protein